MCSCLPSAWCERSWCRVAYKVLRCRCPLRRLATRPTCHPSSSSATTMATMTTCRRCSTRAPPSAGRAPLRDRGMRDERKAQGRRPHLRQDARRRPRPLGQDRIRPPGGWGATVRAQGSLRARSALAAARVLRNGVRVAHTGLLATLLTRFRLPHSGWTHSTFRVFLRSPPSSPNELLVSMSPHPTCRACRNNLEDAPGEAPVQDPSAGAAAPGR
jgi:hypothetical protein